MISDRQLTFDFGRPPATKRVSLPVFRHPGYSKEVVRDAAVPVEAEIEAEAGELLGACAADVAGSAWVAFLVMLLYAETRHRYVRHRAARVLAGTFEPVETVPETRDQCPEDRKSVGCPHVRCRHHLWIAPLAGRPGLGKVPRDERGLVLSTPGQIEPHGEQVRLEARWLEGGRVATSCALDVAISGCKGNLAVGHALQRHRTLAAREVEEALRAGCEAAEDAGIERADFVRALMKMGDG